MEISMEVDVARVSHSSLPICRCDIVSNHGFMVSVGGYLEGKGLASECCECLIRSSPVMAHAYPTSLAPLHRHARNVATSGDVHHVHQQPVAVAFEVESESTFSSTWHSTTKEIPQKPTKVITDPEIFVAVDNNIWILTTTIKSISFSGVSYMEFFRHSYALSPSKKSPSISI